ncbi:DNA polymerase I [Alicyclobacillus hesperidum]|uniref:DNA polymerase I n=1 Tax=Alicyclobacillus hesperidum TaxID=89784 RepID=A0A1H2QTV7_9BACL|nr:DNA polymerase I [Alicyclobacillus hesperidum]SDW10300.1 DNA polymerase I [Alicyclobacillus hesperidum]
MSSNPKLLLIDGNSILYRAFFALPPLSNQQGVPTNAVYGFTMMLLRLLASEHPTHLAVAFDKSKTTFRHAEYAEYKGTRQQTPDDLVQQFPLARQTLEALSIPVVELQNYEADDLIGTLSKRAEEAGWDVKIVSGDKDLLQLVSPRVHALLTRRGITDVEYYDEAAVAARYGLRPMQIVDLKGLMGDTSDNIPGVPGVGEKTAIKLLTSFDTVESVLDHVDEVPGAKLRERLAEHREQALLSKRLATIHRNAPLEVELDDLSYRGYDAKQAIEWFRELAFHSLIDKISEEMSPASTDDELQQLKDAWLSFSYERIVRVADLERVWSGLTGPVGCILDLQPPDYHDAEIRGMALATASQAYYLCFDDDLEMSDIRSWLLGDSPKVVFDLKSMAFALDAHGIGLSSDGHWDDVKLAAYLLNPTDGEVELEDILSRELRVEVPSVTKVTERREALLTYVAAKLPELYQSLQYALAAQELDDLYSKVELPLAFVLAKMEITGFHVNEDKLRAFGTDLSARIDRLTQEIYELSGVSFNINSPKQLGEILFEKLNLPAVKKTKTGYSTSADVLEKLAPYHEVVAKILDYRQLSKLQSTYVDGLLKMIRKETGRIHTRFHQALTATGRLSSSEPNLQNIPIRLEEGRRLRQVFEPTYQDWLIFAADYSQIELRILAHLSGDEALIDAFRSGMDIHTRTASDVFEVSPDEVTPLMRRQAKAVNFGIVYGISDFGLAQNLNIPQKDAKRFIEEYFRKFPGVRKYMDEIVEQAKEKGFVTTLMNRRRYLPDIRSRNFHLRSFAERTAMNTPIQGTAADLIKLAMVRIDRALREAQMDARMLLQVHDELIFECPQDELSELQQLVRDNMENAMTLNVPLRVDTAYGRTWYDAK